MESQGQSFYNALKLNLQRRFSQGTQFGVSYTFAKMLTDAAEDLFGETPIGGVIQNPYDRRALRTPSPNVVPHSLVINFLAELPFGKDKRYLNRPGFVDKAGRRLAGICRSALSQWSNAGAVHRGRSERLPRSRRLYR